MGAVPAFATYPHFFADALEIYRDSTILYFNALGINGPLFIKRTLKTRLIANSFLPGAYETNLALIENDHFLLSAVDLRRLIQLAEDLNFGPGSYPRRRVGGVELPSKLWDYFDEALKLELSGATRYHHSILHFFLWQIAKYYLREHVQSLDDTPARDLVSLVKFYSAEVKRYFRGNGEVNEACYLLEPESLSQIPARIMIIDLPPLTGYSGIPDFLLVRELISNRNFALESAVSGQYPGSTFDSVQALVAVLENYLQHCEHIEFWLIIIREPEIEDALATFLESKRRRSRWFEFSILADGKTFRYLIARRL